MYTYPFTIKGTMNKTHHVVSGYNSTLNVADIIALASAATAAANTTNNNKNNHTKNSRSRNSNTVNDITHDMASTSLVSCSSSSSLPSPMAENEYMYKDVKYKFNITKESNAVKQSLVGNKSTLFSERDIYCVSVNNENVLTPMYGQDVPDNYDHFMNRRICHRFNKLYVLPEPDEIQYINRLDQQMANGQLIVSELCKPKSIILDHMLKTLFRKTFTFNTKTPYSLYLKSAAIADTNRLDTFDKRDVFFVKEVIDNNEQLMFINANQIRDYDDKGICFIHAETHYYCYHQSVTILNLLYERTDIPICEDYLEDGRRTATQSNDYMHSLLKSRVVNNYKHCLPSSVDLFDLPPYSQ
jgi:hypothetical protein